MTDDPLFLAHEAAKRLRSNPRTMERWRAQGTGPEFVMVGRKIAYTRSALEAWIKTRSRRHTHGMPIEMTGR